MATHVHLILWVKKFEMKHTPPSTAASLTAAAVASGPTPGTHHFRGMPGVGPTPELTHLMACPGYQLTVSPG